MSKAVEIGIKTYGNVNIPDQILSMCGISPGAKLAYGVIQARSDGGALKLSLDDASKQCGMSTKQFARYKKELEECGLLESIRIGCGSPNEYKLRGTASPSVTEKRLCGGRPTISKKLGDRKRSKPISPKMRWNVLYRDRFQCRYCGASALIDGVTLHVDHAISVREGGDDSMENYVTSCRNCNLSKSSTSMVGL